MIVQYITDNNQLPTQHHVKKIKLEYFEQCNCFVLVHRQHEIEINFRFIINH